MIKYPTDSKQRKRLSSFKFPFVILAALASCSKSPRDKNLFEKSLKLSNLDMTEEEFEKAIKTSRTRQLQLLDNEAIKPKRTDFSAPDTWNTGEGTSHAPEHNHFALRGNAQLSYWQIPFSLFPALGEVEFIPFKFQTFINIKKY